MYRLNLHNKDILLHGIANSSQGVFHLEDWNQNEPRLDRLTRVVPVACMVLVARVCVSWSLPPPTLSRADLSRPAVCLLCLQSAAALFSPLTGSRLLRERLMMPDNSEELISDNPVKSPLVPIISA